MPKRHELTDAQWDAAQNRIPGKPGDPGQTGEDNRRFLNAVLYVARTGIPWRDLPERYGKWNSVWRRYDRWCASGVWEALAEVLGEPELEELQLDSTVVKAHQSSAGSRRQVGEKKKPPTSGAASVDRAED
jgi:putative transposase